MNSGFSNDLVYMAKVIQPVYTSELKCIIEGVYFIVS